MCDSLHMCGINLDLCILRILEGTFLLVRLFFFVILLFQGNGYTSKESNSDMEIFNSL